MVDRMMTAMTTDAMREARTFTLEFHPASEDPTEEGDYLLYNQCDGFHLASAWIDGDDFEGFFSFNSHQFPPDAYCAWARLPESHTELFALFANGAGEWS